MQKGVVSRSRPSVFQRGEAQLRAKAARVAASLLFLFVCPFAMGAGVLMQVPNSAGLPGSSVVIPIAAEGIAGQNIISVEITINYDASILSFIGFDTAGTITQGWQTVTSTSVGQAHIGMIGTNPLSGDGTLVNVKFTVQPNSPMGNTSQISLTLARVNDDDAIKDNGWFTVGTTPIQEGMPGDANGDGHVDRQDLLLLILAYNKASGQNGYNPIADFNDDGRVDKEDFAIFRSNYGKIGN